MESSKHEKCNAAHFRNEELKMDTSNFNLQAF